MIGLTAHQLVKHEQTAVTLAPMAKTIATQGLPPTIKGIETKPNANMTATVLPPDFKTGLATSIQRLVGFSSNASKTTSATFKAVSGFFILATFDVSDALFETTLLLLLEKNDIVNNPSLMTGRKEIIKS